MEFYTDIAFTILLRVLKDKKQSQQVRKASLKLLRAILTQFMMDKEFQQTLEEFKTPFEV